MTKPRPNEPGRGGAQRFWTSCKYGHPMPLADPPGSKQRKCTICNRIRSARQYAAVSAAAQLLGMSTRGYQQTYGYSGRRAAELVQAAEPSKL